MKITAVNAIPLLGRNDDAGWETTLSPTESTQSLIEVVTDEGVRGYGSAYTNGSLVLGALQLLRPWIIGDSALEPERVVESLHQRTFWQGRGGAVTNTLSGIDMALWDILGKATGQPVARLLGGYYRERIKPYGSIIFAEPARLRAKLEAVVARGFRAIKMGWGPFGRVDRQTDELLVRTARETVGPNVELMVDAGGSAQFWPHSFKWALETARMLADYSVVWFEEPLPPDDIDNYLRLREQAPLFIAGGEVLTRRQSFLPWIERGAVDIIQPDCSKVGGLSEARRIGWMAQDHNILLVTHGWNNAVGLAADLHLAAALPVARWVEYLTPSPFIEQIVATPFQLDSDGLLSIPTSPGLGIELDPAGLAKYSHRSES
ncbi:MAG: mandelate racemase/muconate lactonizing enzyme family protein [Caldilineaceae bacterium]